MQDNFYSSLAFLSRLMLEKVEYNFIERSIVIGTLRDPWWRTLVTGSLEICKLIDFCHLHTPWHTPPMRGPFLLPAPFPPSPGKTLI